MGIGGWRVLVSEYWRVEGISKWVLEGGGWVYLHFDSDISSCDRRCGIIRCCNSYIVNSQASRVMRIE